MIRTIHGRRFNSTLDLSSTEAGYHANLTIHLKVCLQQFAPPEGQAELRYRQSTDEHGSNIIIIPWGAGDNWGGWCGRFEREGEEFFHSKLWLVADRAWRGSAPVPGTGGRTVYRPGVRCGFRMSRVSMSDCHCIVDVANTTGESDFFRSYRYRRGGFDDYSRWLRETVGITEDPENLSTLYRACVAGSERLLLSDGDIDPIEREEFESSYSQRVFLHELGHTIGLGHVNGAGNADEAYGRTAHQFGDLMGGGERIEPWHAFPWKRRLRRHLGPIDGPSQWTATTSRPPVTTARAYPSSGREMSPGGTAPQSLDGGVASRCTTRGCSQHGPEGMVT